jgi:serine/threonine protein kinase/Tfp pilus assembly protein PilF
MEEYQAALDAGAQPDRAEWLARHTDIADALSRCLEGLEFVHGIAPQLSEPGAEGARDDQPEQQVPTGAALGDFRILREVGRGGMGVVYEAEQISLGRRVALKVLPFAATLDPVQLQRFKNEAHAAAQLHHQHIVPVYTVGQERGVHYYAMQFVEGQTLGALIAGLRRQVGKAEATQGQPTAPYTRWGEGEGLRDQDARATPTPPVAGLSTDSFPLSPEFYRAAARLGIQAADALDYAHKLGIIHRDVKPGNLLVDGSGNLWVTDFGLAQVQTDSKLTMTGDLLGTLRYMSPEQALGKVSVLDQRTDIYSLGATLYELLTLEPAVCGRDREEVLRHIAFAEPRPLRRLNKSVPPELETIVLKAMAKEAAERYQSAQELADDLRRFLEDRPIRARRPSLPQRARKWARRHRPMVWSTVACLVMLVAVSAGSLGWIARDRAAQQEKITGQTQEFLTDARALSSDGRLVQARRKLAQARALLASGHVAPGSLDGEIEALEEEFLQQEQFFDGIDRAHQVELAPTAEVAVAVQGPGGIATTLLPARNFEREPAKAVPLLVEALTRYRILEREDWAAALQDRHLGRVQVEQIRQAAYEELLWLADDLLNRRQDHSSAAPVSVASAARQALAYLAKAEAGHPPTTAFFALRSRCQDGLGEKAAADADRERARITRPTLALDHYLLGQAAYDAKNKKMAVNEFGAALRLEPTHYWSLMRLGQSLGILGQEPAEFVTAAAVYTGCLMKRPDHAAAYFGRALAYQRVRQFENSLEDYSRAIALDPQLVGAWDNRGGVYASLGQYDKALADRSQAIKLAPQLAWAWSNRGLIYYHLGQHDKALADFARAMELDPQLMAAWNNRAIVYVRRGQPDQALADFSKAIALDPNSAVRWSNRGALYVMLGQNVNARDDCSKAIELDAKDVGALINRGSANAALGQYQKALADYSQVLALDGESGTGHNYCAWLLATCPDAKVRNPLRAVELAQKAVQLAPAKGDFWNTLGVAQYRVGDWKAALGALKQSIQLRKGGRASDFFFVAMAHLQLGHRDEASRWYGRALKWMEVNKQPLRMDPLLAEELRGFRLETEELLKKSGR